MSESYTPSTRFEVRSSLWSGYRWAVLCAGVLLVGLLQGCSSVGAGVGIGIPLGPLSVGVGVGSGGLTAGVGTGWGPLGVGVGVNQRGQVTGNAGVGVGTGIGGGASIGAGVGTSTVLYDPAQSARYAPQGEGEVLVPTPSAAAPVSNPQPFTQQPSNLVGVQWRDAAGRAVPDCRVQGQC